MSRRRLWSAPRFIRALSPRTVLVFVSSPGDCAAERQIALPPGPAERNDFQRRIDALLSRYGYSASSKDGWGHQRRVTEAGRLRNSKPAAVNGSGPDRRPNCWCIFLIPRRPRSRRLHNSGPSSPRRIPANDSAD